MLSVVIAVGHVGGCGDDASSTTTNDGTEATTDTSGSTEDIPTGGEDGMWSSLADRPCPDDNQLTVENFGGPFILTHCTGCHHSSLPASERAMAPVDVNFDDLALVRAQADRIWARSGDHNQTMPPVGPPPEEDRTRLGEWLACGAPANADL